MLQHNTDADVNTSTNLKKKNDVKKHARKMAGSLLAAGAAVGGVMMYEAMDVYADENEGVSADDAVAAASASNDTPAGNTQVNNNPAPAQVSAPAAAPAAEVQSAAPAAQAVTTPAAVQQAFPATVSASAPISNSQQSNTQNQEQVVAASEPAVVNSSTALKMNAALTTSTTTTTEQPIYYVDPSTISDYDNVSEQPGDGRTHLYDIEIKTTVDEHYPQASEEQVDVSGSADSSTADILPGVLGDSNMTGEYTTTSNEDNPSSEIEDGISSTVVTEETTGSFSTTETNDNTTVTTVVTGKATKKTKTTPVTKTIQNPEQKTSKDIAKEIVNDDSIEDSAYKTESETPQITEDTTAKKKTTVNKETTSVNLDDDNNKGKSTTYEVTKTTTVEEKSGLTEAEKKTAVDDGYSVTGSEFGNWQKFDSEAQAKAHKGTDGEYKENTQGSNNYKINNAEVALTEGEAEAFSSEVTAHGNTFYVTRNVTDSANHTYTYTVKHSDGTNVTNQTLSKLLTDKVDKNSFDTADDNTKFYINGTDTEGRAQKIYVPSNTPESVNLTY